jgi:hypothetical protein
MVDAVEALRKQTNNRRESSSELRSHQKPQCLENNGAVMSVMSFVMSFVPNLIDSETRKAYETQLKSNELQIGQTPQLSPTAVL